jgi:hypothetical protein
MMLCVDLDEALSEGAEYVEIDEVRSIPTFCV